MAYTCNHVSIHTLSVFAKVLFSQFLSTCCVLFSCLSVSVVTSIYCDINLVTLHRSLEKNELLERKQFVKASSLLQI